MRGQAGANMRPACVRVRGGRCVRDCMHAGVAEHAASVAVAWPAACDGEPGLAGLVWLWSWPRPGRCQSVEALREACGGSRVAGDGRGGGLGTLRSHRATAEAAMEACHVGVMSHASMCGARQVPA